MDNLKGCYCYTTALETDNFCCVSKIQEYVYYFTFRIKIVAEKDTRNFITCASHSVHLSD
jgi:hypothetical protein